MCREAWRPLEVWRLQFSSGDHDVLKPEGAKANPLWGAVLARIQRSAPSSPHTPGMPLRPLSPTEEERALLQQRVAVFGKVMFVIVMLGLCAYAGLIPREDLLKPSFALYLVNAGLVTSMWLTCRTGVRSLGFCRGVEALALLGSALSIAVMIRFMLPFGLPQALGDSVTAADPGYDRIVGLLQGQMSLALLIGLTLMVVVRAAIVPSRTLRSVALTVPVGMIAGVIMTVGAVPFEGAEPIRSHTPPEFAMMTATNFVVWWTLITVVCAAITMVIYGLRREVRRARQLGQYTLEEKLGEGGMGTVYRARHGMMRRPTAVKLLKPEHAAETNVKRFEREVQLTARLTHPHTITIFDYGRTPDGIFYYAMELLDGASLDRVVSAFGPLPAGRVMHVLYHVAEALTEAHEVGLIHRDIKPANIILCRQGGVDDFPKVLDFGLVKDVQHGDDVALSQPHVVAGTPLFLAPEAITAPETVSARSDLYALGAVGYFALTGANVFSGKTPAEVCSHHLRSQPEPPSARLSAPVPEGLESLILDCLQKEPARRPAGAHEVCQRLEACADFRAWTAADARSWWEENRTALATAPQVVEDSDRTITRDRDFDFG